MVFSVFKNGRGLFVKKQETIISAAVIIMSATLITKFLGLFKLTLLAHTFGTSRELDVFWAANTIPNTVFTILVLGSLNTALIPVLAEVLQKDGEDRLWKVFNTFLNLSGFVLILSGIIGIFEARTITDIALNSSTTLQIAGNQIPFSLTEKDLMTQMMRIMFISPIILGTSFLISGVLQVYKRFLITQLAGILYTLGFIAGIVVFVPFIGVMGLAWGMVFGSLMHLIIQYPVLKHLGLKYSFKMNWKDMYVKKISILMVPRVIGLGGEQIAILVDTILALGLHTGSLDVFTYAYSLMIFPISFVGWSFAQAAFTTLSEEYSKKNYDLFKSTFLKSVHQITFLVLPLIAVFIILRFPLVRLVFGLGKSSQFDWDSTQVTAWVLLFFSLGILSQSLLSLVVRAFYAMQDTKTPVKMSLISLIINVFLSLYLIQVFGRLNTNIPLFQNIFSLQLGSWHNILGWQAVGGLALASSIAVTINLVLLMIAFDRRFKTFTLDSFWKPFSKKILSATIMGMIMYVMFKVLDKIVNTQKTFDELFLFCSVTIIGLSVYLIMEYLLQDEDLILLFKFQKYIINFISRKTPISAFMPQVVTLESNATSVTSQE